MRMPLGKPLQLAAVVYLAACAAGYAQGTGIKGKTYGRLDFGLNLQNDLEVDNLLGTQIKGAELDLEFDPGMRFDIAAGYNISDSFAAELEMGFTYNPVDDIRGGAAASSGFSDEDVDMSLYQIPMMVNVSYTIPVKSRFKPFVGAGVGGLLGFVHGAMDDFHGTEAAFTFAYQGFVGLNYRATDNLDVGVVYKYLGSSVLAFDSFETQGLGAHMIGLGLVYRY